MEKQSTGWVIVNENHPNNPNVKQIHTETFSYTRKEAIEKFIKDVGYPWIYWYRRFNFRAVKAEMTIVT